MLPIDRTAGVAVETFREPDANRTLFRKILVHLDKNDVDFWMQLPSDYKSSERFNGRNLIPHYLTYH